jgi:Na+/H+-dicarboxylate symporter
LSAYRCGGSAVFYLVYKIIELAEIAVFERIATFLATDGVEEIALFGALAKLRALRELLDN